MCWWSVELWGDQFILQENDTVSSHSDCSTIYNGRKVSPTGYSGERDGFTLGKWAFSEGPGMLPSSESGRPPQADRPGLASQHTCPWGPVGGLGQWAGGRADSSLGAELWAPCCADPKGQAPSQAGTLSPGQWQWHPAGTSWRSRGMDRGSRYKLGTMWMTLPNARFSCTE